MKVIDPGHSYLLAPYDGSPYSLMESLQFMKRVGDKYPGNKGAHGGTNCQEVLRVLIDRVKFMENQAPDEVNLQIIMYLRHCLFQFERRAARKHGRLLKEPLQQPIEDEPTCIVCGHIQCQENHQVQVK